ncbi:hypothetical protein MTR_2g054175 [Medicago truncatula]|uniref:Uncharacterized protein n=1 Tax=Medicago truncatula TaxID=3880 RepID=A0A072V803_MEDTR|nr:hypothetical protein MTR_2g054175 [Medicago truncatula]
MLKEFWGGKSEFYRAIYRASQIKGRQIFWGAHTTHTQHAAEKSFGIEIEDSSLGARIFLSFSKNRVVTTLPLKKNFCPRKLPEGNNSRYETFILLSDSQVALSPVSPTQITFTKMITLTVPPSRVSFAAFA